MMTMRPMNALALARAATYRDMTTVDVQFRPSGRTFTYKVLKKWKVKLEDFLIVIPPDALMRVVPVVAVHDAPKIAGTEAFDFKWAVGKVSLREYEILTESDAKFLAALAETEKKQLITMARTFLKKQE